MLRLYKKEFERRLAILNKEIDFLYYDNLVNMRNLAPLIDRLKLLKITHKAIEKCTAEIEKHEKNLPKETVEKFIELIK